MSCLGNIIWVICGGFLSFLCWSLVGLLWCLSIVGIPIGMQCFKAAVLTLAPFGKEVVISGEPVSVLLNLVWLVLGGLALALEEFAVGALLCLTIIGLPFGLQHFKFARLALLPFGAKIS